MEILEAQLESRRTHNKDLNMTMKSYNTNKGNEKFDLEKEVKDLQKLRLELEADLRQIEASFGKARQEHYDNKMYLDGEKDKEETKQYRHDLEHKLRDELL